MQSPIIKRIIMFGIISGAISLLLAAVGFGIFEFYKIQRESRDKLASQMDILAYNLQPTLLFGDEEAAETILASLRDDKAINQATLYDGEGKMFASFAGKQAPGDITLTKPIFYENALVGRLVIESTYLGIADRFYTYLFISFLIILISVPASYFISAPIRSQISQAVIQIEKQSHRLRLLADQVVATEQKERKRIAALIHDHLQQILVASKLQMDRALRSIDNQQYASASVNLSRGENFLAEAIRAAKSLTVELRPPVLYEDGLAAAFQWLAKKYEDEHNLKVAARLEEVPRNLPDSFKIMLYESVRELLFNVVKYAGVDKAELLMKYEDGLITVSVKDKGRGFDPSQIERTSSDKGFGLFSIRERLKLLNGDLSIVSTPGQGTEVKITIPVQADGELPAGLAAFSAEPGEKRREKAKGNMINILLVDDHKVVREGIANLLRENPIFEVVAQAENGMEAVDKAEIYRPDVVVMDINMPKLNGIEATRLIKNKFPFMDVVGLSVQDEEDVAESMKRAGAVTLLNKAGDPRDLVKAILACAEK